MKDETKMFVLCLAICAMIVGVIAVTGYYDAKEFNERERIRALQSTCEDECCEK